MKITRAYVATKAEVEPMMKATGLRREHVKCGEVEADHISKPKWTMRKGELLGVFDLSAFGRKRQEMAAGVAVVHGFGADVCEVETGAVAGKGVEMLNRALAKVHDRDRGTSARAGDMARKSREKRREGWMPEAEAREVWGNRTKYPKEGQALMQMTGWPRSTAFNVFGPRKKVEQELIEERKKSRARAKR